jgi:hypothetical protein
MSKTTNKFSPEIRDIAIRTAIGLLSITLPRDWGRGAPLTAQSKPAGGVLRC